MKHRINLTQICLLAVLAVGCGPSGPKTYPVSGTVTFNGEAVRKGHIVFSPLDRSTAPDAGEIRNGEFSLQAKAGQKRVEILADREVGKMDPVMHTIPRESYIPEKYNTQSILEREVVPDGENKFVFELEG